MRNSFWLSSIEKRSEVLTNLAVPFTQRRLPTEQWFNTSAASGNLCQTQLSTAAGPYIPSSPLSSVLRTENQKPERQVSWHLIYLSGLGMTEQKVLGRCVCGGVSCSRNICHVLLLGKFFYKFNSNPSCNRCSFSFYPVLSRASNLGSFHSSSLL